MTRAHSSPLPGSASPGPALARGAGVLATDRRPPVKQAQGGTSSNQASPMAEALLALLRPGPAPVYELAERLQRPVDVVWGWLRALEGDGKVRSEQFGQPPVLHWMRVT